MINFFLLFILFICNTSQLYAGFAAGTLIKTPQGYINIENLKKDDQVVCYDIHNKLQKHSTILDIHKRNISNPLAIKLSNQLIITDIHQKLYSPSVEEWLDISTIRNNQALCYAFSIEDIYEIDNQIELYEISVEELHNFYITTNDILAHNFIYLLPIAGEGAIYANSLIPIGAGLFATLSSFYFGKNSKKTIRAIANQNSTNNGLSNPNHNDPEKDGFFEKLKSRSDKKMRHSRFGKFYRDPETHLWWSKDRANHGGSQFKVYQERSTGLEWIYDADIQGNQIIAKHKGPIGKFIPHKELKIYS